MLRRKKSKGSVGGHPRYDSSGYLPFFSVWDRVRKPMGIQNSREDDESHDWTHIDQRRRQSRIEYAVSTYQM